MPWKHNGREIKVGKAWVADNGTQHPAQWSRWSDEKKTSEGLTWEDPPASEASYDDRFYSGRNSDGSLKEKSLTDINLVDEEGNALLDLKGNQLVELGLKSIWIERTKAVAQDKLNEHDWMIVRNAEKSTAIPSNVTTYRDAVRTKCASIETAINNCSNLTQFMALFDAPVDSDGNPTGDPAPINDFPDEI